MRSTWPTNPDAEQVREAAAKLVEGWEGDLDYTDDLAAAIRAMPLPASTDKERVLREQTYAEWQQWRGMLASKVDWAIAEYDGFMLDDAYDAQRVLDHIIDGLRTTRAAIAKARGEPQP